MSVCWKFQSTATRFSWNRLSSLKPTTSSNFPTEIKFLPQKKSTTLHKVQCQTIRATGSFDNHLKTFNHLIICLRNEKSCHKYQPLFATCKPNIRWLQHGLPFCSTTKQPWKTKARSNRLDKKTQRGLGKSADADFPFARRTRCFQHLRRFLWLRSFITMVLPLCR